MDYTSPFVFWILITTFERIQSETIFFQCTLEENDSCRLRSFDGGEEMIVDSGSELSSSDKPIQPWSDASSLLRLTENGYQCQIPYRKGSNPNDLYFCSNSSNSINCLTTNGLEDQCRQGKHHLLLNVNVENREFITPNITDASPNSTCLTFYYYVTKPEVVVLLTDYLNEEGEREIIDAVTDVSFNGWHLARQSFQPNSRSYRIIFRIFRADMTKPSEPFYVAFDQISVTEGNCGSTFPTYEETNDILLVSPKSADELSTEFASTDITPLTDPILLMTTSDESSNEQNEDLTSQSTLKIEETSLERSDAVSTVSSDEQTTIEAILSETDSTSSNASPNEQTTTEETSPETSTIPSTGSSNEQTTSYEDIYSTIFVITDSITTGSQTTERPPLQYSLETVLGISIGLGIPAAIGVVGTLIYLVKSMNQKKPGVLPVEQTELDMKRNQYHHRRPRYHHNRYHEQRVNMIRGDFYY